MTRRTRKKRRSLSPVSIGIITITRKGYGFADTPDGEYFILRSYLRGAMDGDTVEVVRMSSLENRRQQRSRCSHTDSNCGSTAEGKNMPGCVRRVLGRAHSTVVGVFHRVDGLSVVRPLDERVVYDFFLDTSAAKKQKVSDGDLVVLRITTYPSRHESAQGYIEEVIGHASDKNVGIEVIIREHGLETQFSVAALKEAAEMAVSGFDDSLPGLTSRDLRDRCIFSIDPSDAKDHDDALSLDYRDGMMLLGVHIADVSAYVGWNSAIDLDARRRATSVYLPDRVLPMLPTQLSEDLCSLQPHNDRAAFTVDMLLDKNGSVISSEFYPSIVRSSAALSYEEVSALLESTEASSADTYDPKITSRLRSLNKLSQKLNRRRLKLGAIEFESVEAKLELNESGLPVGVFLRRKTDATDIVEEAMILANEQVASYMLKNEAAMVYRIHDEPLQEKLEALVEVLQEFGLGRQGAPKGSHDIQTILEACKDRPEYHLISSLLLRAMKRARYATFFSTHFGLAMTAYTHFTSPIRRYPDLMAHRLLKLQLTNGKAPEDMQKQLDWICEHSSEMERVAEQVSYEATALKLCEFFASRIGERFNGIVVSLNASGLSVREETTTAEGFIEKESLPGNCVFDIKMHRYYDPGSQEQFRLGQRLVVKLKAVDTRRAKLQFVIA